MSAWFLSSFLLRWACRGVGPYGDPRFLPVFILHPAFRIVLSLKLYSVQAIKKAGTIKPILVAVYGVSAQRRIYPLKEKRLREKAPFFAVFCFCILYYQLWTSSHV